MEKDKKVDINLDEQEMTDETKQKMKDADEIHIHKTDEDGEKVDIDIDKDSKTVNVNVNKEKDGKKTNVKIGFSGIKVKDGDDTVNIRFWPIFLFVGLIVCGFFFLIYKVLELIIN